MIITSKNNPTIKLAKQLQTKKFAQLFGKCFLETEKIITQANLQHVEMFFVLEESKNKYQKFLSKLDKNSIIYIDNMVAKFLSQTKSGSDIFAIYKITNNKLDTTKNYLVLDNVQDPANMGALIRSSYAFDFCNIISINSNFPYLHKTLRASMGYVLKANVVTMTTDEFLLFKKDNNIKLIVASMEGKDITSFNTTNEPYALLIGSEGKGVSKGFKKTCDYTVSIRMQNNVESLNASVSAAIIMHKLNNK